jgi:hypothetical protein
MRQWYIQVKNITMYRKLERAYARTVKTYGPNKYQSNPTHFPLVMVVHGVGRAVHYTLVMVPFLLRPFWRIDRAPEDMETVGVECTGIAEASAEHEATEESGMRERIEEAYALRGAGYCLGGTTWLELRESGVEFEFWLSFRSFRLFKLERLLLRSHSSVASSPSPSSPSSALFSPRGQGGEGASVGKATGSGCGIGGQMSASARAAAVASASAILCSWSSSISRNLPTVKHRARRCPSSGNGTFFAVHGYGGRLSYSARASQSIWCHRCFASAMVIHPTSNSRLVILPGIGFLRGLLVRR